MLLSGAVKFGRAVFAATALLAAAGCATLPDDPAERAEVQAENDPFEPANRMMFAINETADIFILRPAAVLYRDFMPAPGKLLIYNFTRHITLPLTIVNDVAQGDWDKADIAAKRFFVNTIAGVGGIADAATGIGLPHHQEDFDQTLESYQAPAGPYLVLPLLGPSSTRHAIGRVVDFFSDPMGYAFSAISQAASTSVTAVSIVDQRYRLIGPLDDVKRTSLDYYASLRSLYRQRRAAAYRDLGEEPIAAEGQ